MDNKNKIELVKSAMFLVCVLLLICFTFIVLQNAQIESANNFNSFCDKKYGINNWNQIDSDDRAEKEDKEIRERSYLG